MYVCVCMHVFACAYMHVRMYVWSEHRPGAHKDTCADRIDGGQIGVSDASERDYDNAEVEPVPSVQEKRKEPMREQRDGKLCGKQGGEDKVYGLKNGIRR